MKDQKVDTTPKFVDHRIRVERCLSMVMHHQEVEQIAEVVKQVLADEDNPDTKDDVP